MLFARNIRDPAQLATLIADIRDNAPGVLLAVDQEGGRVQRLRPPHWGQYPSARDIGGRASRTGQGPSLPFVIGAAIGLEVAAAGFDVVTAPVLDIGAGHVVIGDRAFSDDPDHVAWCGREMAAGLAAAGLIAVGKHAPGHGRARADSHRELPTLPAIDAADLVPFRANADLPWMMTAHIRYTAQDARLPATLSPAIVARVIRGDIGFNGLLITDDLAMGALTGTPGDRAAAAIAAGCDLALHCSGVLAESCAVLRAAGPLRRELRRPAPQPLDAASLRAARHAMMPAAAGTGADPTQPAPA